jgi:cell division protein FtsI/penicillin-binding protein 2
MKFNYLTRIRIISICVFLFALLLIGKLYVLQIVDHQTYLDKADKQYISAGGTLFSRGTIYFQNKDGTTVSAATLKSGFVVAINPTVLQNPEDAYLKLSAILPIDHDTFIAKAAAKSEVYEEVAKQVDAETGQKIDALNIPGLNVYTERWRFYPGGSTAANTIGILGYLGNNYAGRYGLESQYDSVLERTDDSSVNFFAQIFSNIKNMAENNPDEGDIVTTIEPTVQSELEQELASTTAKWSSDFSGGIIMNPATGEIYAMADYPTFNPNDSSSVTNISVFSNPLVEDVYEMGSIVKPLTIAAGIDAGVITATSTFDDKGFVLVDGKKISDFDGKDRGVVTMQTVLSESLNVGAAHVVALLGNKTFTDYMYAFGLGQKTGIDLPNEAQNLVDNLNSTRDIEHFTASFGQGIALTPVSTVRALSAIANGGVLVNPHVVKQINYITGLSKTFPTVSSQPVIKKSTAIEVTRMMVYSVDNVLMNGTIKLPDYSVAAKTGTAQIANPAGGGYYSDRFLHSFVGFFPAYDPKFFIFLYTVYPKGVQYGSETLTEPFMDIVKFLINYYNIPPDR